MSIKNPTRFFSRMLACLILLSLFVAPPLRNSEAAPLSATPDSYNVHFLPNQFFRLCVGDSHNYAFMVQWIENEDPEPVPVDDNGLPLPVPLDLYTARVTATHGTVSPSEFQITSPNQVFRFEYTAQSEGTESIQVTIEGGATGSAVKTLEIIGNCNYDLYFFAKQIQTSDGGGFEEVFNGEGSFSLDRTSADASTVQGSGSSNAALGIWAEQPGLFLCNMVPVRSSSNFKIEGTMHKDYDLLILALDFDPMTFSGNMIFNCSALGLGDVTFNEPIGEQTGDPNELGLVGLSFPLGGGVDEFAFGSSRGIIVVTMK